MLNGWVKAAAGVLVQTATAMSLVPRHTIARYVTSSRSAEPACWCSLQHGVLYDTCMLTGVDPIPPSSSLGTGN